MIIILVESILVEPTVWLEEWMVTRRRRMNGNQKNDRIRRRVFLVEWLISVYLLVVIIYWLFSRFTT